MSTNNKETLNEDTSEPAIRKKFEEFEREHIFPYIERGETPPGFTKYNLTTFDDFVKFAKGKK